MFYLFLVCLYVLISQVLRFDFCIHGVLTGHRDDLMTVNTLCPFELDGPYFSASETNQKASDVNGRQERHPNSSAKKASALILVLGAGGALCASRCPLLTSSPFDDRTLHFLP